MDLRQHLLGEEDLVPVLDVLSEVLPDLTVLAANGKHLIEEFDDVVFKLSVSEGIVEEGLFLELSKGVFKNVFDAFGEDFDDG